MKLLVLFAPALVTALAFAGPEVRTYRDPFEQSVTISGHIDPAVSYHFTVEVTYGAQAEIKSCQTRNWFEGVTFQRGIKDQIAPQIEGDHYSVRVPLKKYDPTTACQWKPSLVAFCERNDHINSCSSVLILREDHQNEVTKMRMLCHDNGFCLPDVREGIAAVSASAARSLQVDVVRKN